MSNAIARDTALLSSLSVGNQPSRLLRIYAAFAGTVVVYPWLLVGIYVNGRRAVSGSADAILGWACVAAFLTAVFAVPTFAFLVAIRNNDVSGPTISPEEIAARRAADDAVVILPHQVLEVAIIGKQIGLVRVDKPIAYWTSTRPVS